MVRSHSQKTASHWISFLNILYTYVKYIKQFLRINTAYPKRTLGWLYCILALLITLPFFAATFVISCLAFVDYRFVSSLLFDCCLFPWLCPRVSLVSVVVLSSHSVMSPCFLTILSVSRLYFFSSVLVLTIYPKYPFSFNAMSRTREVKIESSVSFI